MVKCTGFRDAPKKKFNSVKSHHLDGPLGSPRQQPTGQENCTGNKTILAVHVLFGAMFSLQLVVDSQNFKCDNFIYLRIHRARNVSRL